MTLRSLRRCTAAALLFTAAPAAALDLTIGRATEPSSLDPLFSRTGNNQMTAQHIFDRLIDVDGELQVKPGLAVSWRTLDPLTWEIRLRPDVRFHDGSPLTAEDVLFSLGRARAVPNSPAPFTTAVAAVADAQAKDSGTLVIRTHQPTPLLMEQIGLVYIMSRTAAEGLSTDDFNRGRGLVGTGPYRFRSYVPADNLVLEANPGHWSGTPAFVRVSMRFIPSAPSRVSALLSRQVDLIDDVPIQDVPLLKERGQNVTSIDSARAVYLALDAARAESPFVTDADGRPIANPLRDARVRRALSLMIDRQTIASRLLQGAAEPAAQLVPEGLGGHDPALKPTRADPAAGKALLAEAGWPNGFGLTIHTSSNRFPGDADLGQAIAQGFRRGGLKVAGVEAKPYAVYATEATRQAYSAFVFSFGSTTSNAMGAFTNVLATFDRERGLGAFNRTRYSNAAFDAALAEASAAFDPAVRDALLRRAARIAHDDVALVPLYFQKLYWAARPGLTVEPGKDEATLAVRVRPSP